MINNFLFTFIAALSLFVIQAVHYVYANCKILIPLGKAIAKTTDALGVLLSNQPECPKEVFMFRQLLKRHQLTLQPTMVANSGFYRQADGSFSIFEIVSGRLSGVDHNKDILIHPGEFFFGHFTTISRDGHLILDQNPYKGSLMIEAIAWDPQNGLFNFYELRGNGKQGLWFYRGNSADIYLDNQFLHRQPDAQHPQFGSRLRCSACHNAGGPIMKELYAPHNDWWVSNHKFNFGGRQPDAVLNEILETLVPADHLAVAVIDGLQKLNHSQIYHQQKTIYALQEELRPLFCPLEINFKSDNDTNNNNHAVIHIPYEFFIDSRLLPLSPDDAKQGISIARADYEVVLDAVESRFPQTTFKDADHAWLTPVKALSDKMTIDRLINDGVIDEKFMADVLSIDMTNPLFSQQRCKLLRFLPKDFAPNWRDILMFNLSQSQDIAAQKLLSNLKNEKQTFIYYQQQAMMMINRCKAKLKDHNRVKAFYLLLAQRRAEIRKSEISANSQGEILEPGFRVIFPEDRIDTISGKLKLTADCDVVDDK